MTGGVAPLRAAPVLAPALAGDDGDALARLAAAGAVLLHVHRVDKSGRCRCCVRLHRRWSRRRRHCTVLDAFAVAMTQPFHIVRAWHQDR